MPSRAYDINAILSAHPRTSSRGAPMGDVSYANDLSWPLLLQRIEFEDFDYAPDGTYWGGGGDPLWCAFNPQTSEFAPAMGTRIYARAPSASIAKQIVMEEYPEAQVGEVVVDSQTAKLQSKLRKKLNAIDKERQAHGTLSKESKGALEGILMQGASSGLPREVERAIDLGADPQVDSILGISPIQMAALKGHDDVVLVLLERGCDPLAPGAKGSVLEIARNNKDLRIEQMVHLWQYTSRDQECPDQPMP